ncbi:MAG: di-trans,poly-cis-decaprenylcistransferase [Candidatus Eisenbacteria bacterium]
MQSTCPEKSSLHVAIVMDGNGRWAESRGLPRGAGHRAGVEAARRVVRAAPRLGVGILTVYAFSADNWRRPEIEVRTLFTLLREYLLGETATLIRNRVRLRVTGRRDRLPAPLIAAIETAEAATAAGRTLDLRVAVDYSAREAIVAAARGCPDDPAMTPERFGDRVAAASHVGPETRPVDLLIRAGGERRLSDFLLWECAYAEMWFTRRWWPDFRPADLGRAIRWFHARERRFGALAPRTAAIG